MTYFLILNAYIPKYNQRYRDERDRSFGNIKYPPDVYHPHDNIHNRPSNDYSPEINHNTHLNPDIYKLNDQDINGDDINKITVNYKKNDFPNTKENYYKEQYYHTHEPDQDKNNNGTFRFLLDINGIMTNQFVKNLLALAKGISCCDKNNSDNTN
ncbi:hypothetical protein A3Q56_07823 [Intoshia linei]|uniref:Uncharacterized protein n=1 Tax=Intoshia linei TaxID=1819745 RepID=A0A177AR33_9BILA|nr:hypothetical protein A3Q56_07823 [Intoshia linei]